jgi:hypothetical protein
MSTPFPPRPALDWPEVAAAGSSVAGGKGWTLGRLDRYGLPVLPGFVLPAAYHMAGYAVLPDLSRGASSTVGFTSTPR